MIKCYLLLIINYHAIPFKGSPQKLKLEKFHGVLIILFCVSLISPRLHFSLLKTQKSNHFSASNRWKYTESCFKENGRTFSKNLTNQGNIRISRLKKRLRNLYEKENFKLEINQLSKIYNVFTTKTHNISQKTNKQKVLNFVLGSDESLRVKNALKLFLKVLERKNVQNQTISEIYTDDKKSKRSSNPTDILKSANKFI